MRGASAYDRFGLGGEMGEDFGVRHIRDEAQEIGLGLDGVEVFLAVEVGNGPLAVGTIFAGFAVRRKVGEAFDARLTHFLKEFFLALLFVLDLDEDIDHVGSREFFAVLIEEAPTVFLGFEGRGDGIDDGLGVLIGVMEERRTTVALVRGDRNGLAVEEEGCGEADRFLAHPADGFETLKGEAGDGGLGVGLIHICRFWVPLSYGD